MVFANSAIGLAVSATLPAVSDSTTRTPLGTVLHAEGRTQAWLARMIGESEAKVSRIVNGKQIPDVYEAHAIASALQREIADLWDLEPAAVEAA